MTTSNAKLGVVLILPFLATGCADGIFTVRQDVSFRIVDIHTREPVQNINGTWQRGTGNPIAFKPKADGTTVVRAYSKVIAGGVFPFGFLTLLHVEAGDYVTGTPVEITIGDGRINDTCASRIKTNDLIKGNRYAAEIISIGRAQISRREKSDNDVVLTD